MAALFFDLANLQFETVEANIISYAKGTQLKSQNCLLASSHKTKNPKAPQKLDGNWRFRFPKKKGPEHVLSPSSK